MLGWPGCQRIYDRQHRRTIHHQDTLRHQHRDCMPSCRETLLRAIRAFVGFLVSDSRPIIKINTDIARVEMSPKDDGSTEKRASQMGSSALAVVLFDQKEGPR